jgi:hypothetical protein
LLRPSVSATRSTADQSPTSRQRSGGRIAVTADRASARAAKIIPSSETNRTSTSLRSSEPVANHMSIAASAESRHSDCSSSIVDLRSTTSSRS